MTDIQEDTEGNSISVGDLVFHLHKLDRWGAPLESIVVNVVSPNMIEVEPLDSKDDVSKDFWNPIYCCLRRISGEN